MFNFATSIIISKRPAYILVTLIIFGGIFILGAGAIVTLLVSGHRSVQRSVASERALQIAEAGANYYRWVLAHDPNNYGGANQDYTNSAGDVIGHFDISVQAPSNGSSIVTITSVGYASEFPNLKRTIRVRYGKPSYAQYAFISNTNVWFGDDEEIHGRLHSNGGIRMDGTVDSLTTSIKETYICGSEHNCNNETKPGIWGTGSDPALWQFPIADAIDFDAITLDFDGMKTAAQTNGVYFGNVGGQGVHLVFNSNGTFTAYKVTSLKSSVWGHNGSDWTYESNDIRNETTINGYVNHALPANGIIFVDDQTWVTGQVNGRVTVAAAHLPASGTTRDIIIPDDITYYPNRTSGSSLGLIAQQDILVPLYSASDLVIDAALLAQNGHVMRYYYYPSYYPADTIKSRIETYGTIVTNSTWTWSWVNSSGTLLSGYQTTSTNYDPNLFYSPPPYFPAQDDYTFISWEEVNN